VLGHYVAVALRNIRRAPSAFAINVVTLALGLVCFVTAYAFVAFWDRADRQFPNAERIYLLTMSAAYNNSPFPSGGPPSPMVAEQAAPYLREDFPAIERIARATIIDRKTVVASDAQALRLAAVAVDPEFFDILRVPFAAGDASAALRAPGTVVLTQDAARKLFDDRDPIGQHLILVNAVDATVVGVLASIPEPSHLGHTPNAALPFDLLASPDLLDSVRAVTMNPGLLKMRAERWQTGAITYLLLPATGFSQTSLNAQLGAFAARHIPAELLRNATYEFATMPLTDLHKTWGYQIGGLSFGTLLLALAALVLGVACVNYANLATASAAGRAREVGVRKALGASTRQIAWQSLVEAGLMTTTALVVAVIVFLLGGRITQDLLSTDLAPTLFVGAGVLLFLGALIVVVTFVAGFYPSVVLARVRPASAITAASARLGSRFFSLLLVGVQFAVASVLLVIVMFVWLQNRALAREGLGLTEDPLLIIENPSHITKVGAATLRAELSRLPEVKAVTEVQTAPWGDSLRLTALNGSSDPASAQRPVMVRSVGADFLEVFGIQLLAGRMLGGEHSEDLQALDPGTRQQQTNIVVDREFVATFGLGTPEQAVGKLVYQLPNSFNNEKQAYTKQIVGVVENRVFSLFGVPNANAVVYTLGNDFEYAIARIDRREVAGAIATIDARWKALAPNVPIGRRFVDDAFNQAFETWLRINRLFGLLAVFAFVISVAGLFGMATLTAARRRQEVGLRKSVGASTWQMVLLLLASFSRPVVVANLAVWPLAFVGVRTYLKQFLTPISITPWPFVASLFLTLAIAWLAVGAQTLRVARLAPAEVLWQK